MTRPPWYAFVMDWEVPSFGRRMKWKKRHQRIARLERKLGFTDSPYKCGLDASENIGYRHCGHLEDYGW